MANSLISPGIETKIIDLNNYLNAVPGTVGFVPIITEKGKDNELVRVTGVSDYIEQFGEPDIRIFGKYYGSGPYVATQHLTVSNDLYVVRALPDDATFAHAYIYFSEVDDYPYSYMFAKRYANEILDPEETYTIDLYKVRLASNISDDMREPAIAANAAYDADMQPVDVKEAVVYTSDTKYAELTTYTPLYDIEIDADTNVDKRQDAIDAGVAYDSKWKLLGSNVDKELAVYTSDSAFAAEGAVATHYADDDEITYTRVGQIESNGSKYDNNVGYAKNHNNWYLKTHTSLSAFSVTPDMLYSVQSDVTCYQQSYNTHAAAYEIDEQYKQVAFDRRVGFDGEGYIVLDDPNRIVRTTRVEFAKMSGSESESESESESGDPSPIVADDVIAPYWTVDSEPWYVIDKKRSNIDLAIKDYDAYDKNGFLTNDASEAMYCGNFSYAEKDPQTGEPRVEKKIALRKPTVSKFKDSTGHFRYVMDRKIDKITFRKNAMIAMQRFAAWDKNGYPALSPDDVYITSIEDYAVKAKTPKMNSTQKLDGVFFYGMDACVLACINACEGTPIYSKEGRLPHEAILGVVRAVGRGSFYNDYSIKITSDANPQNFGTYKFQVYEIQNGAEALAESFNVSFDPTALDGDGESLYYVDVINKFSSRVVVEANENALDLFKKSVKDFYQNDPTIEQTAEGESFEYNGFNIPLVGNYPAEVPTFVSDDLDPNYDYIINADFDKAVQNVKDILKATAETDSEKAAAEAYDVGVKGRLIWEAYYAKAWAEKYTHDSAKEYNAALELSETDDNKTAAIASAIEKMNIAEDMTATAATMYAWATSSNLMNMKDSDPVTAGDQAFYLDNGSLGSLINAKGITNPSIADQILCWAYTGLLKNPVSQRIIDSDGNIKYQSKYTDNVYDSDWIYFSLVYDPGYKPDVKDAARELVETYRDDCFLVSDCGDNVTYEDTLKYVGSVKGNNDCRIWNTFRAARFDPYSRIYDKYTGKDIWVSPVYHMAELFPRNDSQYGMQFASAGFNRAVISSIKELRYSANKAQRDQLYLAQINPIVYFPEGMTVWGNLTTQKKASPLSDINNVRVVLYIKRAIESYLRNSIFDLNDSGTWSSIQSNVSVFLANCQVEGLITAAECSCSATEYEIKTKTCHVDVNLTLNNTLEKIELNINVQ